MNSVVGRHVVSLAVVAHDGDNLTGRNTSIKFSVDQFRDDALTYCVYIRRDAPPDNLVLVIPSLKARFKLVGGADFSKQRSGIGCNGRTCRLFGYPSVPNIFRNFTRAQLGEHAFDNFVSQFGGRQGVLILPGGGPPGRPV